MTRAVKVTNDPVSAGTLKVQWKPHYPHDQYQTVILAPGESKVVDPIPSSTAVPIVPVSDPATAVVENVGDENLTERHGGAQITVPPGDVQTYNLTDNRDEVLVTGPSQH